MDLNVFRDISYGMYVVSTRYKGKNVGCFANTLTQITSENPIVSITINKNNFTNKALRENKKFAVSILSQETRSDVIGKFGFYSSKDVDKFEEFNYKEVENLPILDENTCGYIICNILEIINAETHDIFLARVLDSKKQNDLKPMTYSYYHEVIKGKAPKAAPTYIDENEIKGKEENKMKKYQCTICGYVYDEEVEKVKFEDLLDDWACPLCGAGKDSFVEI